MNKRNILILYWITLILWLINFILQIINKEMINAILSALTIIIWIIAIIQTVKYNNKEQNIREGE